MGGFVGGMIMLPLIYIKLTGAETINILVVIIGGVIGLVVEIILRKLGLIDT